MGFFPTVYGPDERIYAAQGRILRERGFIRGLRDLGDDYLTEPEARQYPSALRWLWILMSAAVRSERGLVLLSLASAGGLVLFTGATWGILPAALVGGSPLLWAGARRALQDVTVTAVGLVAIRFGGLALFPLLALKEAAVLWLPAILVGNGFPGTPFIFCGFVAWLLSLAVIFGPRKALALLRAVATSHGHEYTERFQVGGPQRYLVDLMLLSPVALGAALVGPWRGEFLLAAVLLASHCLVRVKNARFILGVDVLLRVAAANVLGPWVLLALVWDAWTVWRLRRVYDPVTAVLIREMRMG